jgi:ATPase family AAA domain-containing protein 3A/B
LLILLAILWLSHAGREIAKFMAAVQAAVYGAASPVLTPELWDSVLQRKLYEHSERKAFR